MARARLRLHVGSTARWVYATNRTLIVPSVPSCTVKGSAVVVIGVDRTPSRSRQQCSPAYPSRGADNGGREKLARVDRSWHYDLCKGAHARGEGKTRTSNPLIGTWRLLSWENRSVGGEVSYPLGKDAVGYIMYGQDGYMSVAIMRPDRAKFAAGDLLSGSAQERAQTAGTYVSYCGRYEFRGDTVVHHVELSLFPNWIGVEQERLVEVTGDRSILSTRPLLLGGARRTAHLIWEAVGKGEQ